MFYNARASVNHNLHYSAAMIKPTAGGFVNQKSCNNSKALLVQGHNEDNIRYPSKNYNNKNNNKNSNNDEPLMGQSTSYMNQLSFSMEQKNNNNFGL